MIPLGMEQASVTWHIAQQISKGVEEPNVVCRNISSIINSAVRSEPVLVSKQSHCHWRWRNKVQLPDVNPIEGPVLNPPGLNLTLREVEV